jgi:hypothetical protein
MHRLKLQTNLVVAVQASRVILVQRPDKTGETVQGKRGSDSLEQRVLTQFLGLSCHEKINLFRCLFFHAVTSEHSVCFPYSFIIEYSRSTIWFHCL